MKIYWTIVALCFVPTLAYLGLALFGLVMESIGMQLHGDSAGLGFGLFFSSIGGLAIGIPLALIGLFLDRKNK